MVTSIPISWCVLTSFNHKNPPNIILGRKKEVHDKYIAHNHSLKESGKTVKQHIMDTVFRNSEEKYIFQKNNFPYHTFDGIEHHVLWLNPRKMESVLLDWNEIRSLICEKIFESNFEVMENYCVYFQNAVKYQSIRGIPHVHIFKLVR